MAQNKTTQARNDTLDFLLRTRDPAVFLALFTGDPGVAGSAANEVAAGVGYSRQAITFAAAANGATSNSAPVSFGPASGAGMGLITHSAVCRSNVRGTADLIYQGPLDAQKQIDADDTIDFDTGEVDVNEE